MQIEINNLLTIAHFAKNKGLSRQHVYRLAENEELTLIKIDDVAFILLDHKAAAFERKRRITTKEALKTPPPPPYKNP